MENAQDNPQSESVKQPKKEMLTWTKENNYNHVRINYSSLELLQTCLRKAHYRLNKNYSEQTESTALAFGSSIHKALEYWYQLPVSERALPDSLKEDAELMANGHNIFEPAKHGALEAIRQFVLCKQPTLSALPDNDKRSLQNGVKILRAYFKHYADDGMVIERDSKGPLVEREFETVIHEENDLKISYFGTIDCILKNTQTGAIIVTDHKTTHALGKEFYDRCKPNYQYSGYIFLARQAGINTNLFMINGIQIAKTKIEFARQITDRTEEDFESLKEAVTWNVKNWLRAMDSNTFPQGSVNMCSMYGGCTYRKVCEVPGVLKASVIEALYGK